MKFYRPDTHILISDDKPVDRNDPTSAETAIEYAVPEGFSDKAKATMDYFEGAGFIYEYKDRLVFTDESLYLTDHGDGSHEAPWGGPRGVYDSWEALERDLEKIYEDLKADENF